MNLPKLTAEQSLGPAYGSYVTHYPWIEKRFENRQSADSNIKLQVEDNTPRYILAACTRSVNFYGSSGMPTEHCYLRLRDSSQKTVDSLSFSPGIEAASSDFKPDHFSAKCQIVDYVTLNQWQQFKQYYRGKCSPEQYSLAENNCCTCVKNSVESILRRDVPRHIEAANNGLGIKN